MFLTDEQSAFRDSIRRMVEKHVRPIAAEIDRNDRFPAELVPIYGDMGLLQLFVPEEYGGPGGALTTVCMAREEIARVSLSCAMLASENTLAGVFAPGELRHRSAEAALADRNRKGQNDYGDLPHRAPRWIRRGQHPHEGRAGW